MTDQKLSELMTNALTDGYVTFRAPTGETSEMNPTAPARLWAALADDRDAFSMYLLPDNLGDMTARVETIAKSGRLVIVSVGVLRYCLEGEEGTLTRLCLVTGCRKERSGAWSSTAYCLDHITDDDGSTGLDDLEEEVEKQAQGVQSARWNLAKIREASA